MLSLRCAQVTTWLRIYSTANAISSKCLVSMAIQEPATAVKKNEPSMALSATLSVQERVRLPRLLAGAVDWQRNKIRRLPFLLELLHSHLILSNNIHSS